MLIGDANGADKAVQTFLHDLQYHNVVIYCSGDRCRNNIGNWQVNKIPVPSNLNGNKYYMVKDERMAKTADCGFMLWDGKSPGTVNNIYNMLMDKKIILLYHSPEKKFYTIAKPQDVEALLAKCKQIDLINIEKKIDLRKLQNKLNSPEQMSIKL